MYSVVKKIYLIIILVSHIETVFPQQAVRVACWNVENFFDCIHDTLCSDLDFTPTGANHWTYSRFIHKRNSVYKVIADIGSANTDVYNPPSVVGLVEVENGHVLRELCLNTPLRRLGYNYIHYDSPDVRGIDCAILYLPSRFIPLSSRSIMVSDSSAGFFTRDILYVEGLVPLSSDTLSIFVCHLPSKRGGVQSDRYRFAIGSRLRDMMDSISLASPNRIILAMGDFNAIATEPLFTKALKIGSDSGASMFVDPVSSWPDTIGSYKYQGRWETIDHILINRDCPVFRFSPSYLLEDDDQGRSSRPYRTYRGPLYIGGISDHLPIYVDLPL